MSRFFPHTPYAEDQPLSYTILASHVLYRGFQAGSVGGILTGSVLSVLRVRRSTGAAAWPLVRTTIMRSTGIGAAAGIGAMMVALPLRMNGRSEIEWQDRSWRLLENQGQMEVDDWSLAGTAVGGLAAAVQQGGGGWKAVMGKTGLGSIAGVVGYMGWRYGVRGGER